jgi:hypothetical protein
MKTQIERLAMVEIVALRVPSLDCFDRRLLFAVDRHHWTEEIDGVNKPDGLE